MTRKQEFLREARERLGLDFAIDVAVNSQIADATVSQAGLTVYIFESTPPAAVLDSLKAKGCGCSTFGSPLPGQVFDLYPYAEMFLEWGFAIPVP